MQQLLVVHHHKIDLEDWMKLVPVFLDRVYQELGYTFFMNIKSLWIQFGL